VSAVDRPILRPVGRVYGPIEPIYERSGAFTGRRAFLSKIERYYGSIDSRYRLIERIYEKSSAFTVPRAPLRFRDDVYGL